MKFVTLTVVDEPASFDDVRFSREQWKEAKARGDIRDCAYSNAREAIRNSGGMYRIKVTDNVMQVEVVAAKDPSEMTSAELVAEMTAFGKPPRKKMKHSVAVDFVRKLREEAAMMIVDDDTEDEDE